jgi:hypothetical protein
VWRLKSVTVPPLGLAASIASTVGGDGVRVAPAGARRSGGDAAAGHAPGQRWGSAAKQSHLIGRSGNVVVPQSMRGRYPQRPRVHIRLVGAEAVRRLEHGQLHQLQQPDLADRVPERERRDPRIARQNPAVSGPSVRQSSALPGIPCPLSLSRAG